VLSLAAVGIHRFERGWCRISLSDTVLADEREQRRHMSFWAVDSRKAVGHERPVVADLLLMISFFTPPDSQIKLQN